MIKYLCFSLLFVLSQNFFAQEKPLSEKEAKEFKSFLKSETAKIKTVKTDFVQIKHLDFMENDIESSGKMLLKTDGGSLKWQYLKPNNYSVIFKEDKIFINDEGKKSTVDANQEMFKKINKLISGSISGNLFEDNDFDRSFYKEGENNIVKLTPKDKTLRKYIKQVVLYFPQGDAIVSKVKLIEPSDDYTLITFKNKKINVPIDASEFRH